MVRGSSILINMLKGKWKVLLFFVFLMCVVAWFAFSDRMPTPTKFNTAYGWVQVDSFTLQQEYALLNKDATFALRTKLWDGSLPELADLIRQTGLDTQLVWTTQQLRDAGLVYDDHTVTGIDDTPPTIPVRFTIAPNPHSDLFAVDVDKPGTLVVYDVHGFEVYRTNLIAGINVIDMDAASGVYFARFHGETIKITRVR